MKLKIDFVTNSSSTAYIVAIPDGFILDDYLSILEQATELESMVDPTLQHSLDSLKSYGGTLREEVEKVFDNLEDEGEWWLYDPGIRGCRDYVIFDVVLGIFKDLKLVLHDFENGPENYAFFAVKEIDFNRRVDQLKGKI